MKFNWGHGIAVFFSIFVLTLVYFVYRSTQYDFSLVAKDYYAKDLNYQQHYDRLKNNQTLIEDIQIRRVEGQLEVLYPENFEKISGEIHLFYIATAKADQRISVSPGLEGRQLIDTQALPSGKWKVKIDWQGDGIPYYREETVLL